MSSVTFNQINIAFDTINYPFSNILLGLFVKGTKTVRVIKVQAPVLARVKTPVAPVITRVTAPVAPTYTRVS
tara:strand:- start:239 stop:454 length:216 start_codon:yes stop_codon:yes gene_type:complete